MPINISKIMKRKKPPRKTMPNGKAGIGYGKIADGKYFQVQRPKKKQNLIPTHPKSKVR